MKNSPKQTLEKLLPIINDIYLHHNLSVTAHWEKYHYKHSCGFCLKIDPEIEELLTLHVNDPEEIIKRIFWERWSLITKNIDNILKTKFEIIGMASGKYFRTLKLIDVEENKYTILK
jgi:hypothetical protein